MALHYTLTTMQYGSVVAKHDGEMDLKEDIDASTFNVRPYSSIFTVRRLHTDDLYPYDAETFLQWFSRNKTDPVTREPLHYLQKRVNFKQQCLQHLPHLEFAQLTDNYRLELWRRFLKDHDSGLEVTTFVTLETLNQAGVIWDNQTFTSTVELLKNQPQGTWMLRKSSRHESLMKNADVVVLAFVGYNFIVIQKRYLHVHGVGWYCSISSDDVSSFKNFTKGTPSEPEHTTLIEILMEHINNGNIKKDLMFIPQ